METILLSETLNKNSCALDNHCLYTVPYPNFKNTFDKDSGKSFFKGTSLEMTHIYQTDNYLNQKL